MFVTLVAHSYFKLFVTAFIEINGEGEKARENIFGKPPMKIILPLVNVVALIECIFWVIFSLFVLINVAAPAFHIFIVFVPLYIMFIFFLVSMVMVYILFTISMFRFARSALWVIAFIIGLPIGFVNVLLFFGTPLIFGVILPLQAIEVIPERRTWVPVLFLCLGLFGAFLKGFVRPTEDDTNPYASHKMNIPTTLCYFGFLVFVEIWLVLFVSQKDRFLIFTNVTFAAPSYWIIWIPLLLCQVMLFILFFVKAILNWKTVCKKHDPNGDSVYNAIGFTTLLGFLVLMLVSQILVILKLDRLNSINLAASLIPIPLAFILLAILCLVPLVGFCIAQCSKKEGINKEMQSFL